MFPTPATFRFLNGYHIPRRALQPSARHAAHRSRRDEIGSLHQVGYAWNKLRSPSFSRRLGSDFNSLPPGYPSKDASPSSTAYRRTRCYTSTLQQWQPTLQCDRCQKRQRTGKTQHLLLRTYAEWIECVEIERRTPIHLSNVGCRDSPRYPLHQQLSKHQFQSARLKNPHALRSKR